VLWDYEGYGAILGRQAQRARDTGALAVLAVFVQSQGLHAALGGELPLAAATIAEADGIAEATQTRIAPYAELVSGALRGREAETSELIALTIRNSAAEGQGIGVQCAHWVAAVLHNGLGRYDEALAAAQRASEIIPELLPSFWALAEMIEAATRTGEMARAADALESLVAATSFTGSDWGLGIQARARALVSDGEEAERSYREAIERLGRTHLRPDHARAHLLYGEWLRRQRRRMDAREELRTAHDMFTEIGMLAFAERARHELLATGETVRKRREDTLHDLRAQEEQIARLAIDGRTNPEIGPQLFISARTVESHLRKVFTKLDITSRRGLRDALPARAGASRQN
jgi:DNA-binding CsgD family transcriptional regulator